MAFTQISSFAVGTRCTTRVYSMSKYYNTQFTRTHTHTNLCQKLIHCIQNAKTFFSWICCQKNLLPPRTPIAVAVYFRQELFKASVLPIVKSVFICPLASDVIFPSTPPPLSISSLLHRLHAITTCRTDAPASDLLGQHAPRCTRGLC